MRTNPFEMQYDSEDDDRGLAQLIDEIRAMNYEFAEENDKAEAKEMIYDARHREFFPF